MPAPAVRTATDADVDAIAALSALQRRRLSEWAPTWWRMADGADDLHPLWLGHLVASDGPVVRVAVVDDEVLAAAVALPQGATWFVDDVVAATDEAGTAVLAAVAERPALTCVPAADAAGARRAAAAGWAHVSSYWIGPPTGAAEGPGEPPAAAPAHSFGPALAAGTAHGLPAPPIYDPGGTVTVTTALAGLEAAATTDDVLVALVVAVDDDRRAAAARAAGLVRTVDVWAAPASG